MMEQGARICIADPNPRVRKLLHREFRIQGHEVVLAGSSREVMDLCLSSNPPCLVVLDPELSCADLPPILSRLSPLMPMLPVVLHAFPGQALNHPAAHKATAILEKGSDTPRLAAVVLDILADRSIGGRNT